jgi:hypothetical protein
MAIDPQVRSRVEQAINDLDHVIRGLRDAVFGLETRLKDRTWADMSWTVPFDGLLFRQGCESLFVPN